MGDIGIPPPRLQFVSRRLRTGKLSFTPLASTRPRFRTVSPTNPSTPIFYICMYLYITAYERRLAEQASKKTLLLGEKQVQPPNMRYVVMGAGRRGACLQTEGTCSALVSKLPAVNRQSVDFPRCHIAQRMIQGHVLCGIPGSVVFLVGIKVPL